MVGDLIRSFDTVYGKMIYAYREEGVRNIKTRTMQKVLIVQALRPKFKSPDSI